VLPIEFEAARSDMGKAPQLPVGSSSN
jgi:hypothetical protein